jgi:hypothetical protein
MEGVPLTTDAIVLGIVAVPFAAAVIYRGVDALAHPKRRAGRRRPDA